MQLESGNINAAKSNNSLIAITKKQNLLKLKKTKREMGMKEEYLKPLEVQKSSDESEAQRYRERERRRKVRMRNVNL